MKRDRDAAKQLLFELQDLFEAAGKAGIKTEETKLILKKANVAYKIETADSLKEMLEYLREGKITLEKAIVQHLAKELVELKKEIETRKREIPPGHAAITAYNVSVNALKKRNYLTAVKNLHESKKQLATVAPASEKEHGRVFFNEPVPCYYCESDIRAGVPVVKCTCGKTYHEICAARAETCGCGIRFGTAEKKDTV